MYLLADDAIHQFTLYLKFKKKKKKKAFVFLFLNKKERKKKWLKSTLNYSIFTPYSFKINFKISVCLCLLFFVLFFC